MNGLLRLLLNLWIWRTNLRWEKVFIQKLKQEQDTVRLKWDDIMGSEHGGGRHHLRRR